jgi:hypothetical protein
LQPLRFGQLWPETLAVARRHADLLLPVAGLFLFLPQLLLNRRVGDALPKDLFGPDRIGGDLAVLALVMLLSLIGQLVVSFIAFSNGTGGRTLGSVIRGALPLLLPLFAVTLMQGLAVGFGLILLVVPGIFLLARFSVAVPLVATGTADPLDAISTSWRLTEGHSLAIMGFVLLLLFGFLLVSLGIGGLGAAIGVVSTVAAGQPAEGWGLGRWLFELLSAGASTALGLLYICFNARLLVALKAGQGA